MARESSPIEFSALAKGFVTDSSALNYQPDSASVLENFNLNLNGSIQRRNGLVKVLPTFIGGSPWEYNYLALAMSGLPSTYYDKYKGKMGSYLWTGAGETANSSLIVISGANSRLSFYLVEDTGLTQVPVNSINFTLDLDYLLGPISTPYNKLDFTVSGTKLLICNGSSYIYSVEYIGGVIEHTSGRLTVRDQWGVKDIDLQGNDLNGDAISLRPIINGNDHPEVYTRHLYNLMNQGWADPVLNLGSVMECSVTEFLREYSSKYGVNAVAPSNSDILSEYMYPDTTKTSDATVDRYHARDHVRELTTSTPAPRGRFVIDLIDRYTTREARRLEVVRVWGEVGLALFPYLSAAQMYDTDSSAYGGPSTIATFAGRVWYSGITNAGITNDWDGAPDLSKLVLFSQLASSDSASLRCYQAGDPTAKDNSDVVATDGGFIVLPEAEVILKIVPVGDSLVVVASNGVWAITGGEGGFTATDYKVSKVSSDGCISYGSITVVEDSLVYFAQRGIIQVGGPSLEGLTAVDISKGRILEYYHSLSANEILTCSGSYDPEVREVVWNMLGSTQATELKLSLDLNAFFKHVWKGSLMGGEVLPIQTIPLPKALSGILEDFVVVNGEGVVVGGEEVSLDTQTNTGSPVSAIKVIQQLSPYGDGTNDSYGWLNLGFAISSPATYNDWESFPINPDIGSDPGWVVPSPIDSPGTIVTGALTGGDTQRYKTAPMLTMLFNKTEDGFYTDLLGDIRPSNESSCKVQAQWEWTNSANSNRWGREFQAYRHKRLWMPEDVTDGYEDGHSVVTTKNRLRGKGRALSLKMTTEPDKDCQILGWSYNLSIGDAV